MAPKIIAFLQPVSLIRNFLFYLLVFVNVAKGDTGSGCGCQGEGYFYSVSNPIDLSHAIDDRTMTWARSKPFKLVNKIAERGANGSFYAANEFEGPEHAGTHLDAPYHFNENGWKVADIPLENLMGPGILVDVSSMVNSSDFQLLPMHLEKWQQVYGKLEQNVTMLVAFGWASKYGDRKEYFGSLEQPYSFPGISTEAAEWIVKNGQIRGVGVDTPSMDYGKSTVFATHTILSQANLFGLENVNLFNKTLPAKNFSLIVMPMKLREGSGAPCRIVAV